MQYKVSQATDAVNDLHVQWDNLEHELNDMLHKQEIEDEEAQQRRSELREKFLVALDYLEEQNELEKR